MDSGRTEEGHRSFETGRLRPCQHQYRSLQAGCRFHQGAALKCARAGGAGQGPQHVDAGS